MPEKRSKQDSYVAGTSQEQDVDLRTGKVIRSGPVKPLRAHRITREQFNRGSRVAAKKARTSSR
jgi:hypothetical protein